MRDAPTLAVGMICRFTAPHTGNTYDAIIRELDTTGRQAMIEYQPVGFASVYLWVDTSNLSVPR